MALGKSLEASLTFAPARQRHFAPEKSRVLVIDDEALLRATYRRILRDDYEISVAESGEEVLQLGDSIADFDVILCDYMLQDMNGLCLLSRLQELEPEIARRFVFCTGGCDDETIARIGEQQITILEKPCTCGEIQAAVARRIAENRRRDAQGQTPAGIEFHLPI